MFELSCQASRCDTRDPEKMHEWMAVYKENLYHLQCTIGQPWQSQVWTLHIPSYSLGVQHAKEN